MKFICNGMLGRLCRYLRICGIDTLYSNEGIKALFMARKEGRIFLTKNTKLIDKQGVFFVDDNDPIVQVKTVIARFELIEKINFFSRCICCNELLLPVEKEKIKDRIPFYTYKNFNEFAQCPKCQRVFWKGSHYQKMVNQLKEIIG
ncbi:MAG: Mut7-C RNAse domain-containing protein [candidate division WOR-3 bacterium]